MELAALTLSANSSWSAALIFQLENDTSANLCRSGGVVAAEVGLNDNYLMNRRPGRESRDAGIALALAAAGIRGVGSQ